MAGARSRYDPDFYGFEDEDEPQTTQYIEGVENLRPSLEDLVSRIYANDATTVLTDVLPLASIDPKALLEIMQDRPATADSTSRSVSRHARASSRPRSTRSGA